MREIQSRKRARRWFKALCGKYSQGGGLMIVAVLSVIGSICSILGLAVTVYSLYISTKKK